MDYLNCNNYPFVSSEDNFNCESLLFHAFDQDFAIIWILLAFGFGFVLSFAVGANDSANSWGTPVGAGTISLGVAYMLGSVCETIGATFLSKKVISGVAGETSVINMDMYKSNITEEMHQWYPNGTDYLHTEKELMIGYVVSMIASQSWQLIATYLGWPVSGTHAIIFSEFGFTIVEKGPEGVNMGSWDPLNASGVSKVVYGLVFAPLLGFIVSFLLYLPLYKFTVKSGNPRGWTCKITYSACVFLMIWSMLFFFVDLLVQPPKGWDSHAFAALVGAGGAAIAAFLFLLFIPILFRMKRDLQLSLDFLQNFWKSKDNEDKKYLVNLDEHDLSNSSKNNCQETNDILESEEESVFVDESEDIKRIYRPLQLVAACYGSINHGANDVANCIGPVVICWYLYKRPIGYEDNSNTLYGVNLWGGFGISLGLLCFGSRVIMTMGSKISRLTPSYGFTVVLSGSIIVMACSCMGLPASTTHCQVMGVVGAGIAKGWVDTGSLREGIKTIDTKILGSIALSWILTIPFAGALSATLYAIVRRIVIGPF